MGARFLANALVPVGVLDPWTPACAGMGTLPIKRALFKR